MTTPVPVTPAAPQPQQRKDYISDQMVRWCPGCGDFAILAQVQKTLPMLGRPREQFVFVSGIGCSSRFPYYVNTYGFHTIHGRAPAIATGVKTARPDLSVWVVTGDGDGLSIGGNHLIHALRRNVDIKILLFNNEIYGLTKGQASPTSPIGQKTKSTPFGSIDRPIHPIRIALAAEATFVARTVDTDLDHLGQILDRAYKHKGSTFIEIYQNCIVFNNGAFEEVNDKSQRDDNSVKLEHGKPLIYGKNKDKGIRLNGRKPEIVSFPAGKPPSDLLVHDEFNPDASFAYMLAQLEAPEFPHPLGVFRQVQAPTLEDQMKAQHDAAKAASKATLQSLLNGPETWEVA